MDNVSEEISAWLRQRDPARLAELWRAADRTRRLVVGDEVHLRGLIEISNRCVRECAYCGLRAARTGLPRYRMSHEQIMACVQEAVDAGHGTVVLQSGEDPGITLGWMRGLVRRIKSETPLAVTLSLGERSEAELAAWREAGADRYFLRFETSNSALYRRIHPPLPRGRLNRMAILRILRKLGYEVGSGVMIGISGQTHDDLAQDIRWFGRLRLDMIGVGPYVAHPDTPLGRLGPQAAAPDDQQVPATDVMTCKVIALARILYPETNIPSTTALATVNRHNGRELGLMRGANVLMPNLTPREYRLLYEIYPNKAGVAADGRPQGPSLQATMSAIGRTFGVGRGDSPSYLRRSAQPARDCAT